MHNSLNFLISVLTATLLVAFFISNSVNADDALRRPDLPADAASSVDHLRDIKQLITQLGSDRYVERRRAQLELGQLGTRAFDALHEASSDADPEIATAATYLLAEIPIVWSSADDPRPVRKLLSNYGNLTDRRRLVVIQAIADLPLAESLGPLCRIVRFDTSELLSRTAAIAVLRPRRQSDHDRSLEAGAVTKLLGGSDRRGAEWLRLYARQQSDPADTVVEWERFVDTEVQLAGQTPNSAMASNWNSTSDTIVVNLLWHLLNLYQQLDQAEPAVETVARILDHDPSQFEQTVVELIDWFAEGESWSALDKLLSRYREQISKTRRPQYVAAIARQQQGQNAVAEQLASAALALSNADISQRIRDAQFLIDREHWEWAKREYQKAIDDEPIDSQLALIARIWFAMLLSDLDENGAAAAVLEPVETKIEEDTNFRRQYNAARKQLSAKPSLPTLLSPKELSARRHFYLARDCNQRQDWENERKHLQESIVLEPEDADVIIAMFRAQGTDEAWQKDVRRRIVELSGAFQEEIGADPNEAQWYNQWAWLIGNTEGDFQKAIRYSTRSLEVMPRGRNPAVYLDTLGRCYFAAGDLENAVKTQRKAVEQDGSFQVMRRQLAEFEKALAESQ